ncbi:probable polygalacturonase at3g15720, partial [Phtheirospermum japonicum]
QAFKLAWKAACREAYSDNAKVTVPFGKTFLVSPIVFQGPCSCYNITFEILGSIVAPPKEAWKIKNVAGWLRFQGVDRLAVIGNGQGIIDGQGATWWDDALLFSHCNHLQVNGLKHINSQKFHVSLSNCDNSVISRLHMIAPSKSPNTDGIDIGDSTNVSITNCTMETGDDCIAIKPGSSNVAISEIACGPGHGISIGSLGAGGTRDQVEGISVSNCTFNRTQNGIRIKTWQGGSGFVRNIKFMQINFTATDNPVVIDQFYCPHSICANQTSAVKVSNVTFQGLRGTSPSKITAVNLRCSDTVPCTHIVLDDLHILSTDAQEPTMSYCNNAYGIANNTYSPPVNCLLSEQLGHK